MPSAPSAPGTSASYEHDVNWFGTVRGRRLCGRLAYVTAGYAYGQIEFNGTASGGGVTATLTNKAVQNGWTVGAGTELALSHWSAKLEYLYVDLGSPTNTVAITILAAARRRVAGVDPGFAPNPCAAPRR